MTNGISRVYSHNRLISWTIRRCKKCKRFIGKNQKRWCLRCANKMIEKNNKECFIIQNSIRTYKLHAILDIIGKSIHKLDIELGRL